MSIVNGVKRVFTFGFDYDAAFHDQVGSKAAIEFYAFVDEWNGFLALDLHSELLQFIG